MTARIIDGKAVAQDIQNGLKTAVAERVARGLRAPALATVLVGQDPASEVYVRNKRRTCEALGIRSVPVHLDSTVNLEELLAQIERLNADPEVDGILVQLPLPRGLDEHRVTQAIAPAKDVDGFHHLNVGRVSAGLAAQAFVSCTPAGCMELIARELGRDLSGLHAVVLGRSNIVGKPMAALLLAANATVTIAHSRTHDLPALCRQADVLVTAVGRANLVRGEWIKPGAVVIDVGINRVDDGTGKSRLTGDVAFDEAMAVARAVTPVPGGVGPMTVTMLMANTLAAARHRAG